jgi:hypothetical protein
MRVCERCRDVVIYCSCVLEDPSWIDSTKFTNNPSFWIFRGNQKAEWDRVGRNLFGDQELIDDIKKHLHGEYVEVLKPGFSLWMDFRDPNAVYFVAKDILKGCTFSDSAPDWSEMEDPNTIY